MTGEVVLKIIKRIDEELKMKKNLKNTKTKAVKVTAAILAAMMLCGTFGTVSYAGGSDEITTVEVSVWGTTISVGHREWKYIAYDDDSWYVLYGSRGTVEQVPLANTGQSEPEDAYAQANQYFGYIGSGQTEPETEYVEPTTEYVEPTTEYVEPETTTEYVEPTTEYVEPETTTVYVEPETEYVEPETEYVPETEAYVEPETEYTEPAHVHNWVDSLKKQYVWVEGECTEARTYSPKFNKQHWMKCGCGNYTVMVEDENGNFYADVEEAFIEHNLECGYNFWDINTPIDIIGYTEKIHTGKKFNGTWELLDTMYCADCDCYLIIDTGEVVDKLYTDYYNTVSYKVKA